MRNALSCAAAALLAGCSLIPDMETPASPVAGAWPDGPAYAAPAADARPFADLGWNEVFQAPDLRRLIETAIANNRDLRVAALNVEAARATYRVSRADLYPQVDGAASGKRARTPAELSSAGRAVTAGTYSADLGVTAFELDFFGRVRSLEAEALERFLATEEARVDAQISLVAEVAQAWLAWQADRDQLRLAEETLASRQQSLDLVAARFRNGVATQLDVAQARSALETARVARVSYVRAVAQDRNALELLVGRPLAAAEIAETGVAGAVTLPPVGTSSEVLLRRPDIREAEHKLRAANADIGAARAAFFPTISLTGSLGVSSASLGNLFEGASRTWAFGPNLSVPIFTAGRNQANLDAAKVARDTAVATYEKAIQTAFREVADALAARATLVDEIAAQRDLVAANREALDLSQRRYARGVADYLDVLDAQRELFTAQQTEISLRQQEADNLVALYKALGGGAGGSAS
ncbi:Outer membrane protein OprM [uncultured Alphaproteobacteria bacterium]|uniref:Outer membrane protein OprM n=1 Tax=uncultured Alphaproteobacteria bacterium TaxID=91750 RepID=A0A212IUF9_9PROT|nr:Outer membrane protein OprM [uncultured Alphaproteobacteria bacterium]